MNRGGRSVYARALTCALRASASLLLALAVLPPSASAFESGSATYTNKRSSLNQGGKRQSSSGSTYSNVFSAGEVSLTTHTSTTYKTRVGFETISFYPGKITGLYSSSGTADGTIYLQWTAPGNDGYALGTSAGRYDIRFSSVASLSPAKSETVFNAAAAITPAPPTPASQGATQPTTATSLLEGVTYYFAMKAHERDGIPGVLSAGTTAQSAGPFGCRVVKNVCKSGECGFTTIQSAVNALPNPLIGYSCVIVRDSEVYAEQVTVQNFVNNGSSITIARGPEITARPSVAPPLASTAAFRIANSSVNIFNIDVKPTISVAYGVLATSDSVRISSVNVDSAGSIWTAGLSVVDRSTVSYSSVTVQAAHGLRVLGSGTLVQSSTFSASGVSAFALDIQSASTTTIQASRFISALNTAGNASGAQWLTVRQSTFTAGGGFGFSSIAGSNGLFTQSYFAGNAGGVILQNASSSNTVSQSTLASLVALNPALTIALNSSSNTVTDSFLLGVGGHGLQITAAGLSHHNTVRFSTITAASPGQYGVDLLGGATTTILNSYVSASTAVHVAGATGTVVGASVLIGTNTSGSALWMTGVSVNLLVSSSVLTGGAQGAGINLDAGNKGLIVLSTNTFQTGAQFGLLAANQAAGAQVWVTSNTIVPTVTASRDTYGIYLNGLTSGATLYNNSVVYRGSGSMGANTSYALFVQSGAALKIENNRFSNPGSITAGTYGGVFFTATQNTSFKFNDLHAVGPTLTNGFLLQLAAGTTVQARNNIYASSMTVTGSSATLTLSANSGIDSDYNDYFSSNSAPSYFVWGSTAARGLTAWQAASGKDLFSQTAHPLWFNTSAGVENFHPLSQGTGAGTGRCSDPPFCTTFVSDPVSSLTIDAADPAEPFANEQAPNGNVANQGSFGNTIEASMSPPILSVVLSTGLYDFGSVNMNVYGSTISVSSVVATNNGSVTETFQLSAAVVTPGGSVWQLGQQPDIETVKLQALFNSAAPNDAAFTVVATTITVTAQPSGNAGNNGNRYSGDQSGYAVPAQGKRGMWFRMTPPTSTINNGVQQTIRVTVTAIP